MTRTHLAVGPSPLAHRPRRALGRKPYGVIAMAACVACVSGQESGPAPSATGPEVAAVLPVVRQLDLHQLAPDAVAVLGGWLAVGPGGQIAFAPASTPDESYRLRVVDTTGAVLARIGPQGSGPGELVMPMYFDFADDGTLVVWDANTTRVTKYAPSGAPQSSQQVGQLQMPMALIGDSLDSRSADPEQPYMRRSSGGGAPRPLIHPSDPVVDSVFPVRQAGDTRSRLAIPYAAGAGRIALGHATSYRILLFDNTGKYVGSTGRLLPPQFPSAEAIQAESLSLVRQPSVSPERRTRLLAASRTRPIPYFSRSGLKFDHLGRLWVIRQQDGSAVADIYADVALVGTIALDCPGFNGSGVGLKYGWLVLSCRTVDPGAPSEATMRLFRIEG